MAFDVSEASNRDGLMKRAAAARARGDALFAVQSPMLLRWQALAEIFDPERADFTQTLSEGQDPFEGLFSSEPQILARNMANRFGSMTRPEGSDWFKLTVRPDQIKKRDDVRAWCDEATTTQRNVLYAGTSGFAIAMPQADRDYVIFGNSVLAFGYNKRRDGIYVRCCHLRDVAWAEDTEGKVNELHERMKPTLAQAVELFGEKNLPKQWRDRLKDPKSRQEKVDVRRCVWPLDPDEYANESWETKPRKGAKFVSIYYAVGVDEKDCGLREGYFEVFPYAVNRWVRRVNSVYGRSPCANAALADGRTLNIAEAAILKGIEFATDPALTAPDDGFIGEVRIQSGAMLYRNTDYDHRVGGDFIQAVPGGEAKTGTEYAIRKEMKMAKAFFMDLLLMPDREMTLGEYQSRLEVVLRDAAPVFSPIMSDYSRFMDGVFDLIRLAHGPADPWGGFDPAPEALGGAEVTFEFLTALTQKFTELKRLKAMQVKQQAAELREAQDPSVDVINMDEVTKASLENYPVEWTRKPEEVEQVRQSRQAQADQAKKEQELAFAAQTAAKTNPEQYRQLKEDMQGMAPAGAA